MPRCVQIVIFWAVFCASIPALADLSPTHVVQSFVEAYNAHDVDKMLAHVTDDIRWMSVDGEQIGIEASGKTALGNAMKEYFTGLPSARSEIRHSHALGDFVSVIEKALWSSNGVTKSQCAVAVYQLRDGYIANVWYHSAQPCD